MVPFDHTSLGILLGALFLTASALSEGGAEDFECQDLSCAETHDSYLFETEPLDSELYLLQRKALIIKKATTEDGSLSRDQFSFSAGIAKSKASGPTCMLQPHHSRSSAFVTAARAPHVPMSQRQRLAMLSTTEVSGLSETATKATVVVSSLILILTFIAFMTMMIVETQFGRFIRLTVQRGLNTVADDILGLDVTFGSMLIGVFRGSIIITDLKLANPPSWSTSSSQYFMTANAMDIRLNLWSYAWRRCLGKKVSVEVDSVTMKDVQLHVERSSVSSNIQEILDTVYGHKEKPERKIRAPSQTMPRGEKDCKLTLHKMTIVDACATVPFWGHVTMPAVHCKDFDKATQGQAKAVRPIVAEILREFCQTGEWASEFMVKPQQ